MSPPEKGEYRYCPRKPSLYFVCVSLSQAELGGGLLQVCGEAVPHPRDDQITSKTTNRAVLVCPRLFCFFFALLRDMNMSAFAAFVK